MRKVKFHNGEYYHIFNRGVDKRKIFSDDEDLERFLQSMREFNVVEPIGSLYAASFRKKKSRNLVPKMRRENKEALVGFTCYCLNPNHYHLVLQQLADRGIEKFMHRLGLGYSNYFNKKYDRSGSLFQGTFKATHIESDRYLLYASAYVNLNNKVHKLEGGFFRSSWDEYMRDRRDTELDFCDKNIILNQFAGRGKYRDFTKRALEVAWRRKELERAMEF